jgi:hypothetical protein
LDTIRAKLLQTQALMELHPSSTHSVLTFSVGDQVLVAATRVHGGPPQRTSKAKWQELWRGPFTVSEVLSPNVYKLDMPDWFMGHPVFNVEYLKQWHGQQHNLPPTIATMINSEDDSELVKVLSPVANLVTPLVQSPAPVRRSARAPKPSWRLRVGGDE